MYHADILNIDRGHSFRKHRHKNNKKVAVIYEKTVKNRPLAGYLPTSCHGAGTLKVPFPTCVVRTRTYQGFFPGGTGGPPSSENFANPPSDTCPRFWTKACPPPPAEVRPQKFEKFEYIFVSNLT